MTNKERTTSLSFAMPEYIEREPAVAFLENMAASRYLIQCFENKDRFPDADVEPVRHGEWLPNPHHYGVYVCSKCQCADQRCQPNFEEVDVWKSCPNCGAKMDGKGEEQWLTADI